MKIGRGRFPLIAVAAAFATLACKSDEPTGFKPNTDYGVVAVRATTSGGDPDDRYDVSIGAEHRITTPAGYATFTVAPGTMVVKFEGVAVNCVVEGETARTVTVAKGETVVLNFSVGCLATGVVVTTHTVGSDFPDNYYVSVAGLNPGTIGINSTLTISRLTPGTYSAKLILPGENCTSVNTKEVTIEVTNRNLTPVNFELQCNPPTRLEKIAFSDDSLATAGTSLLYIERPDGSNSKLVGYGKSPTWSGDGSLLAFNGIDCTAYWYYYYNICIQTIMVTDPEVGWTRTLPLTLGMSTVTPAWSPTSPVIAFINSSQNGLWLISLNGGEPQKIPTIEAVTVSDPSWSPDGQKIAVGCVVENNLDICIFNRDGSGFVRVTRTPTSEFDPSWSPDGSTIAYVTNESGVAEIAVMAVDGSGAKRITQGFAPSWTRSGALAFSRDAGTFTIRTDGTGLTQITSGKHRGIVWRP
jgi:hypothetical protein